MKNYSLAIVALWAVMLLLGAPTLHAQNANPPTKLTYQGFLTDALGTPLGDSAPINTNVVFRIYTASTGGTLKWSEQQTVTIDKGHFSVLLGEGSPVGSEPNNANLSTVFTGNDASDRYMELTVGNTAMSPRLQFQPAPYAMLAQSARQIVDSNGATILSAGSSSMTFSGNVAATTVSATNMIATNMYGTNFIGSVLTVTNANTKTVVASNIFVTNVTATTVSATNIIATNVYATNVTATTVTASGSFVGNGTIPVGGIIMWSGATVPAGWALCNGTTVNGVTPPDLRDRFIVSSGSTYAINAKGGTNTFLLTAAQVPLRAHEHTYDDFYDNDDVGDGTIVGTSDNAEAAGDDGTRRLKKTRTTSTESLAATVVVDNRPAYYALAFIMRVQ